MIRRALCWAVVGLVVVGFLGGIGSAENVSTAQKSPPVVQTRAYTPHAPIRINNDAEFNASFTNRTIWNLEINGTGKGCCLFIGNCSVPFTVKDCYFHNASNGSGYWFENYGIDLDHVSSGTIVSTRSDGNQKDGIQLFLSSYNILSGNTLNYNSNNGIFLSESNSNQISNNHCTANGWDGLRSSSSKNNIVQSNNFSANLGGGFSLTNSENDQFIDNICINNMDEGFTLWDSRADTFIGNNCTSNFNGGIALYFSDSLLFRNNRMYDNGLYIQGDIQMADFNSFVIDSTNTVNRKPIWYVQNRTGFTVPLGAGQVIIVNCSYIKVEKQDLSKTAVSILAIYSSNCDFNNNTCTGDSHKGICLVYTDDSQIFGNDCSNGRKNCFGIQLDDSQRVGVIENSCNNMSIGIYTTLSNYCTIGKNQCNGNAEYGMLIHSNDNIISENDCSNNNVHGIEIDCCNNNTLFSNYISTNTEYGIHIRIFSPYYSFFNRIYNNTFIGNNAVGGRQACDDYRMNMWNDSMRGNYWSDWARPDNNSDGIVDFPYYLDGGIGARDYYPIADTNPPHAEIISPKNGDTINGNVIVEVKASDDLYLYSVDLSINGTVVTSHQDSFTYVWDTSTITNGLVNLSAEAMDASNNHMWYNITVNVSNWVNHAPDCSITSPVTGDIVSRNVTITGTASDPDGILSISGVEVRIDSGVWKPAIGIISWSFAWDTTSVSDGSHQLNARSMDVNSTYSNPIIVTVTVNNGIGDKGNVTVFVVDNITKQGIVSANVSIPSLGLIKTTDNSGYSNFTGIVPGNYDITVSKTGYEDSTLSVTVNKTETTRVHFYLVPITCIETKVMGKVVDNSTGKPIDNVTIRIGNYTTKSNPGGRYLLKLPAGNYKLNVTKDGYMPYERNIHVNIGNNTIDIRLEPVELKKAPPDFTFFTLATIVMIAGVSVAFAFFAASISKKKKKPVKRTRPKETDEEKEENQE